MEKKLNKYFEILINDNYKKVRKVVSPKMQLKFTYI